MMATDVDALVCDMAETYHVLNMWALPVPTLATLAAGLRENSRIKMRMSGARVTPSEALLAAILDKLSIIVWQRSQDGVEGKNFPPSVFDNLMGTENNAGPVNENAPCTFSTPAEFYAAWKSQTGGEY